MSVDSNSISAMLLLMGFRKENIAEMTHNLDYNISVDKAVEFLSSLKRPASNTSNTSTKFTEVIDLTESTDDVVTASNIKNLPPNNLEKSLLANEMKNKAASNTNYEISKVNDMKILSYNLWFNEDIAFDQRMSAISNIIQTVKPNFICFQEVTPNMYKYFSRSDWWPSYKCSLSHSMVVRQGPYFVMLLTNDFSVNFISKSFEGSIMGRELVIANSFKNKLLLSTSHFESPVPPNFYEHERKRQLNQSINWLSTPNSSTSNNSGVPTLSTSSLPMRNQSNSTLNNITFDKILIGDLNWTEKRYGKQPGDGLMDLPSGWKDAWTTLHGNAPGYTYDAKNNPMLKGYLQGRLDRCICNLKHFQLIEVKLVGCDPIPGAYYQKPIKSKKRTRDMMNDDSTTYETLPVLPSDHYGILITLSRLSE